MDFNIIKHSLNTHNNERDTSLSLWMLYCNILQTGKKSESRIISGYFH